MSGLGGSSKQTTTTNSEPWKGAQPALSQGISAAQDLYNKGTGAQVYTGSTVVPWSQQSQSAMNSIQRLASPNMDGLGLSGQYQDVINRGGYNDETRGALDFNRNVVNTGGYNAAQNAALANTQALANSQYEITPELQKVLDATGAKAAEQVNLGASAAGRYGSGMHQGAVAREVGDITNRTVLSDYNNFLGRRDAANNNLFQMGQTGQGNTMAAAGNITGLGQQAFGNLGTAYSGMNAPAQDMMTVGAMYEDLATRQMNDQLRIFNEQQNLPWENVSRLNAIASGAGALGGTTRQTQPGQNPFMTALGYGASGLGLLGSFI